MRLLTKLPLSVAKREGWCSGVSIARSASWRKTVAAGSPASLRPSRRLLAAARGGGRVPLARAGAGEAVARVGDVLELHPRNLPQVDRLEVVERAERAVARRLVGSGRRRVDVFEEERHLALVGRGGAPVGGLARRRRVGGVLLCQSGVEWSSCAKKGWLKMSAQPCSWPSRSSGSRTISCESRSTACHELKGIRHELDALREQVRRLGRHVGGGEPLVLADEHLCDCVDLCGGRVGRRAGSGRAPSRPPPHRCACRWAQTASSRRARSRAYRKVPGEV